MKPLKRSQIKKLFNEFQENNPKTKEICFLLQSFESPYNVGSMFRLADACGASKLVLTGKTPVPPNEEIEITAMRQTNRIPFEHFSDVNEAIKNLKEDGFHIVSIELTEEAVYYKEYDYPNKVCFVLGNETSGVFDNVLSKSDKTVYIPMFGANYSLNVYVSAAIVAYDFLLRE